MDLFQFIYLFSFLGFVACRVYSIENPDGSFSIGTTTDSRGEQANALVALLTKSAGYTIDDNVEQSRQQSRVINQQESRGLLTPHLEILQLIEVFLKFKGELASRFYDVLSDNYDLIRSVYQTVISKIGNLHSFSVTGIKILRRILEFAITLMAQWQVNIPPISLGFNVDKVLGTNQNSMGTSLSYFNTN